MLRSITSADEFKDKKEVDCNRVSHLGNLKNWSEAFNYKNVSREREIFFFLVGKRKKETQKRVHSTNTFSGEPATRGVKERERQKKEKKKKKKKTQQSSLCAEYVERT